MQVCAIQLELNLQEFYTLNNPGQKLRKAPKAEYQDTGAMTKAIYRRRIAMFEVI